MAEDRKQEQKEYYNFIRDRSLKTNKELFEYYTANKRFYSIDRKSTEIVNEWVRRNVKGKHVLDYCCGRGSNSIWIAKQGAAKVDGIDISDTSVDLAINQVKNIGLEESCAFNVMDAENLQYDNNSFDVIYEVGSLHHLDINKAYAEMARVLKPSGVCICREAIAHNPLFQLYRRMTPHLRTSWEVDHIFRKKEIELANKYFRQVRIHGFYHLFSLLAVPLRNTKLFEPILTKLERIDNLILKIPAVKWLAWKVVFELSDPIKVQ